jgi:hypothetical protein
MHDMLKSSGRPSLLLKIGGWVCICIRQRELNENLKQRLRPRMIGGLACWCDKSASD